MTATDIVNALLEADAEYVGDPMQYALGAADVNYWAAPKSWVHELRALGFELKHGEYKDEQGKIHKYFASERTVKLKSGERMLLNVSEYTSPELEGQLGISVKEESKYYGLWGSRPIKPNELLQVTRDIIRRLENLQVEYSWNSYSHGLDEAVNKALLPYEFWHNERKVKKV